MNRAVRFSILIFIVILTSFFGWYTLDLTQHNSEEFFLGNERLQKYQDFKKKFPAKKFLIAQIKIPDGVHKKDFSEFHIAIDQLRKRWSQIEILTFFDIYKKAIKKKDWETVLAFRKKYPHLNFSLLKDKTMAFIVLIDPNAESNEINSIIKTFKENYYLKKKEVSFAGLPYMNSLLDYYSNDIKIKIFPILFLVAFVLCIFFTKSLKNAAILFLPSFSSFMVSLGLIKLMFESLNMVTSIVPLLIFVVNLSLGFHLFFATREERSFRLGFLDKKFPILLMIITTCVGFGALGVSEILVIRQFSYAAVLSILSGLVISLLWFYAIYGDDPLPEYETLGLLKSSDKYFKKSLSYKFIAFFSLISIGISVLIFPKMNILTDALRFFPKGTDIRKQVLEVNKNVLGVPLFEVLLYPEKIEGFDYIDLKHINWLEELVKTAFRRTKHKLISVNQLVKESNKLYSGNPKLPLASSAYYLLKSGFPPNIQEMYPTQELYRFTIFGNPTDAKDYFEDLKILKSRFKNSYIKAEVNGIYYNLMHTQETLIKVLGTSFLISLLIISFLGFLFLKDIKIFFIFLLTNLVPITTTLIFIYVCDLSLNIASVMTFSISLGMIVDSSFHLVHVLKSKEPFEKYYKTTIAPILASSILLIISCFTLSIYGFLPIRHFALSLSFALLIGLIFDLYVLPTLVEGKTNRMVNYEG